MSISYFDKTIRRCAERGMTMRQCAEMIKYSYSAVNAYAGRESISFHGYARRQAGPPRPELRAKCAAMYGKASASEIAKELGITRNAVIGHWFRARKSGEIRA